MKNSPSSAVRPISVMVLISSLEYGGAERQVVEMVRTFDRARVKPIICSLSKEVPLADSLKNRAEELVIVEKRSRYDFTTVPKVARLMREHRIDVVHGFLFDAEMVARLAGFMARVPVVIASERNSDYRRPLKHSLCWHLTRPLYDGLIANSSAGREHSLRTLRLAPENAHVVHNGVNVEKFQPNRAAGMVVRKELDIGADDFVVGMVASFKRQKRHEDFLQMAAAIRAQRPNTWFLVAGEPLVGNQQGSGDYHEEIRQLVAKLGLQARCLYLGARKDVPAIYNACDLTVLPSSREGTPNVLLESMACGVPVVATAIADNRQIVKEGIVGHVVPVGDVPALIRRVGELLDHPAQRAEMGKAAGVWMREEFSLATVAQKTEAIYRQYLEKKGW